MSDTFRAAYASEFYKLSKNKEIVVLLLIPVALTIFVAGYLYYDVSQNPVGEIDGSINPWQGMFGKDVFQFFYLLYPILVAIFVHACCDIEYKNNNYKVLFTLPISKHKIFIAKVLFIFITVLLSVSLSYFAFLLCGYLLGVVLPEIGFQNYDFRSVSFFVFLKLYVALAAISSIQLCLSLQFKNFIYPIGFGMFLLVFSMIVWQKDFSDFIPYTGSFKSYLNMLSENTLFERLDYLNLCSVLVFLVGSFYLFKRKIYH